MSQVYRTLVWVSIAAHALTGCVRNKEAETATRGVNEYQKISGDDGDVGRNYWNQLFNTTTYVYGKEPAVIIRDHLDLLKPGRALDIAMGEGRNAVFLARKGFSVDGVDYSVMAIRKALRLAKSNHVAINTINADLNRYAIAESSYDVILNINYLQRSLIPQIKRGLKPGGVVVFENQTTDVLKLPVPLAVPSEYLLNPGELRQAFEGFEILVYHETNTGKDVVASLIARKP